MLYTIELVPLGSQGSFLEDLNLPSINYDDELHIWLSYLYEVSIDELVLFLDDIPQEIMTQCIIAHAIYKFTEFIVLKNKNSTFWLLVGEKNGRLYILAKWQSLQNNPLITFELIMDWIMNDSSNDQNKIHVLNYRNRIKNQKQ